MNSSKYVYIAGLVLILFIAGCSIMPQQQAPSEPTPAVQPAQPAVKLSAPYKGVFAYSQVDCDPQTKQLSFTLYNIFDHPIDLRGEGEDKIQIFLNSVPLTGLDMYCGADVLQPGEHADCFWSPAISVDARVMLEKPIVGVEYENTIAARMPTYDAKTVFSCNQRHPTHFITSLGCDSATQDLSFGIKNVFDRPMYLKQAEGATSVNVVQIRVNNHPLSALAQYCGKDALQPGESVDCVKKGSDENDKIAKPKGGDGKQQNDFSMVFDKYTSEVSFVC